MGPKRSICYFREMEGIEVDAGIISVKDTTLDWWIDTGAARHVCNDISLFWAYKSSTGQAVTMGNEAISEVRGTGNVTLTLKAGKKFILRNVQYVPEFRVNLISGSMLTIRGYKLEFVRNKFLLTDHGLVIGTCRLVNSLFKVDVEDFEREWLS